MKLIVGLFDGRSVGIKEDRDRDSSRPLRVDGKILTSIHCSVEGFRCLWSVQNISFFLLEDLVGDLK
jgi:hypothetical protein